MARYQYRFRLADRTWSDWHECQHFEWCWLRNARDFEKQIIVLQ